LVIQAKATFIIQTGIQMNKINTTIAVCTIACLLLLGCTPRNQGNSTDSTNNANNANIDHSYSGGDLIHIDVRRSHPVKDINLEDIARIEFLQLEMHDDFLFSGSPRVVTENYIIFGENFSSDVIVFSREGKPLHRWNRVGQGPEEFTHLRELLYDEAADEIFIITHLGIMVYSLTGEFSRMLRLHERVFLNWSGTEVANFDAETFLLHSPAELFPTPFSLFSKKDGSLIKSIDIPRGRHIITTVDIPEMAQRLARPSHRVVNYQDGFLLSNFALDTAFFLSQSRELSPILVRTPRIHSMSPVVYLNSFVETGGYQFFSAVTVRNENFRLPTTFLMRDKQTSSVYRQRIYFDEFRGKEISLSPETIAITQNSRLGLIELELTELQDANEEGRLSGRLKELVENSEEDGNNIFMLLHFK
jgi:hypothetical protein